MNISLFHTLSHCPVYFLRSYHLCGGFTELFVPNQEYSSLEQTNVLNKRMQGVVSMKYIRVTQYKCQSFIAVINHILHMSIKGPFFVKSYLQQEEELVYYLFWNYILQYFRYLQMKMRLQYIWWYLRIYDNNQKSRLIFQI